VMGYGRLTLSNVPSLVGILSRAIHRTRLDPPAPRSRPMH
jgi:hypothetical protein